MQWLGVQGNVNIHNLLPGGGHFFVRDTISSDSSAPGSVHVETSVVPRPIACSAPGFLQKTTLAVG